MTDRAHTFHHYRTLLQAADRQDPATVTTLSGWNRQITRLVEALRENTGCNWVVELEQDATFFATVTDIDKHGQSNTARPFPFGVRFSLWGELAALVYQEEPPEDEVAVVGNIVERHSFTLVPHAVLSEPYDGIDPTFLHVGDGRWYDRFFQYY